MRFSIDQTLIRVNVKRSVIGRQARRGDPFDEAIVSHAVLDEVRNGDHEQTVLARKRGQLFHPRHCPVVLHDLADDAGRIESRQSGQIDGRLGLSGANEDAATTGPERKHVSGTRQISRCRCWINRRPDGGGSVRCRDTRTRDPLGFDCHREGGFETERCSRRPSSESAARRGVPPSSGGKSGPGRTAP